MAASLLSPPPSSFLHVSKLSFASSSSATPSTGRCLFTSPIASAKKDPVNEGPVDDRKNSFKYLYGLPPSKLNLLITKEKYATQQPEPKPERVTEEIISSRDSLVNHSEMGIGSGMSDGGPPKYITNMAGGVSFDSIEANEWPPRTSFGWSRTYFEGNRLGRPPDFPSHFFYKRLVDVGEIDTAESQHIISQLLWLDEHKTGTIYMHILSSGNQDDDTRQIIGPDASGYAIADTMEGIESEIYTVNLGYADGLAAMLLSLGVKGHRSVMPHSLTTLTLPKIPMSSGIATDMWFMGKELDSSTAIFLKLLSKGTGKPAQELFRDLLQGPKVLKAQQAIDYGLADKIVKVPKEIFSNFKELSRAEIKAELEEKVTRLARFQANRSLKKVK